MSNWRSCSSISYRQKSVKSQHLHYCMNHSHWTVKSQVKKVAKKMSVFGFLKRCYMQKLSEQEDMQRTEEVRIGFFNRCCLSKKRNGLSSKS